MLVSKVYCDQNMN